eukprot:4948079-Pyramimonas_sp.AAC.1
MRSVARGSGVGGWRARPRWTGKHVTTTGCGSNSRLLGLVKACNELVEGGLELDLVSGASGGAGEVVETRGLLGGELTLGQ